MDWLTAARAAEASSATDGMKPTYSRETISSDSYRVGRREVRVFAIA